jgi:hypothetical protein
MCCRTGFTASGTSASSATVIVASKLALCRELLGMAPAGPATEPLADYRDRFEALTGQSLRTCPHCHTGTMVVVDCIARPKICQPIPDTS